MKITEHTERDDNRRTFYSLEYGDVFVIENDDDNEYYLKLHGYSATLNGIVFNAVSLTNNVLCTFVNGTICYRVDAELIIDTVYNKFLKK